jgi:hypothetical protein
MAVLIVTIGVIATTLAEAEHKQHATKAPNNPVGCLNCNNNDLANTEAKAQVRNGDSKSATFEQNSNFLQNELKMIRVLYICPGYTSYYSCNY